jgi:predicted RNA-binding protein YlxR (DUF448 family)
LKRAGKTVETDSERTCIVTRQIRSPSEMLRFVIGPDESVVFDLKRNLPGRGVWVTAKKPIVAEAVKRQAFAKSFKAKARAAATLAEDVDRLLEQGALQSLSICNKAGLVSTGAAKVEKAIASAPIAAMVHATDGGADGVRKIGQALTRAYGEAAVSVPRIILFASGQLDLALGRSNVIHAALKSGAACKAFLERCRHLSHYRSEIVADAAETASSETVERSTEISGSDAEGGPVQAGADDRNQRGGGPDHCQQDRPERGSGANVMTSGRGPGIETI